MMSPPFGKASFLLVLAVVLSACIQVCYSQAAPKRINCGGKALIDKNGNRWMQDLYYKGGKDFESKDMDDELLRTERWANGHMEYNIPVTPGVYDVRIGWSENYSKSQARGKRVFHVFVEGILAFKEVDIYKDAGNRGYKRVAKTFRANAVGGYINIEFVPQVGNPKVGTIEILPVSNTKPPHPDVTAVVPVEGEEPQGNGNPWADSYSVGNQCFCDKVTTYDHNIGEVPVETSIGWMTVRQACELLGPGPGRRGRPIYNDVQCGNGPPNDQGDEQRCPGRVDLGKEGCGHIGPKWNFEKFENPEKNQVSSPLPVAPQPTPKPSNKTRRRFVLNVGGKDDDGTYVDKKATKRNWKWNRANAMIRNNGKVPKYFFKSHRSAEEILVYKIDRFDKDKLYRVTLGFAEVYLPNCRNNARVLSIRVNDRAYAKNLDVYKEAGCNTALINSYVQKPDSNGEFNIFIGAQMSGRSTDKNAMLSLIDIEMA